MKGECVVAAAPLDSIPGLNLSGKRDTIKGTGKDGLNDAEAAFSVLKDAQDGVLCRLKPGRLLCIPSGHLVVTYGAQECVGIKWSYLEFPCSVQVGRAKAALAMFHEAYPTIAKHDDHVAMRRYYERL